MVGTFDLLVLTAIIVVETYWFLLLRMQGDWMTDENWSFSNSLRKISFSEQTNLKKLLNIIYINFLVSLLFILPFLGSLIYRLNQQ